MLCYLETWLDYFTVIKNRTYQPLKIEQIHKEHYKASLLHFNCTIPHTKQSFSNHKHTTQAVMLTGYIKSSGAYLKDTKHLPNAWLDLIQVLLKVKIAYSAHCSLIRDQALVQYYCSYRSQSRVVHIVTVLRAGRSGLHFLVDA